MSTLVFRYRPLVDGAPLDEDAADTLNPAIRAAIFASYETFAPWLATVPQEGERQFRHMLRYFLFPDRVERMSSNRDRRSVLAAYDIADPKTSGHWSDR